MERVVASTSDAKTRAVVVDRDAQTVVVNYNGNLMFPGGKLHEGESPERGLGRELEEELGINLENPEHLLTYRRRDRDYPTVEGSIKLRRSTYTTYFLEYLPGELPIDSQGMLVIDGHRLSERERLSMFVPEIVAVSSLRDYVMGHRTENPRWAFFRREMLNVITAKEQREIGVEIESRYPERREGI